MLGSARKHSEALGRHLREFGATLDDMLAADQVIVGKNETRPAANGAMREALGIDDELPADGEKLICVKNNRETGFMNGDIVRTQGDAAIVTKLMIRLKVAAADGREGR